MIEHTLRYTLPAAYALLPERMASPEASALLLAIGLQESQFLVRRQRGQGPARGFWQFERAGVLGVLTHPSTGPYITAALYQQRYEAALTNPTMCHALVEDHDTIAAVFARLLLWTLPGPLPGRDDVTRAWAQYLRAWRPGAPRPATWAAHFGEAWDRVDAERGRRLLV